MDARWPEKRETQRRAARRPRVDGEGLAWDGRAESFLAVGAERPDDDDELPELDRSLALVLPWAARAFVARLTDELMLSGLTGPQWLVLQEVVREVNLEPSEVASKVGMARPTATEILGRLVARGLLTKDLGFLDSRARVYSVTERGRAVAFRGLPMVGRAVSAAVVDLTAAERAALTDLLGRVIDSLAQTARTPQTARPRTEPQR